jgi:hypothetical protein
VSELYEIVYSGKPVRVVVANNFVEVAKKAAYWYNKKKKAKRASVDIVKKLLSVPHIHIDEKGAFFYPISKKDGDVKFVRLKSKELKDGLDEVKKRKIHRRDNSRGASKKLTEIRRCYEAFEKLQDVLEGFTWKGFESLKLKNSTVPTDLYLKSGSRQLLFNAQWIKLTAEKDIAAKLRSFVQYT